MRILVDAMGGDGKIEVDREKRRVYGVSTRRATPVADDFGNRFVVEFDREIASVEGGGTWCCVRFAPTKRGDVLTAMERLLLKLAWAVRLPPT